MFKRIWYQFDMYGKRHESRYAVEAKQLFATHFYLKGPSNSFDAPHYTIIRKSAVKTDPWAQGDGQPFEAVGHVVHPVIETRDGQVWVKGWEVPGLVCGGLLRHPYKMKSKVKGPWFSAELAFDRTRSRPETLCYQSIILEV